MDTARFNNINKVIASLLVIIGLIALLAYRSPDMVAFSSFLALPYLILYPAPSVVIYAGAFGLLWFTVGRLHGLLGCCAGLAAMWVIGYGIPQFVNSRIEQENVAALQPDLSPSQPLDPGPVITLVEPFKDPAASILKPNSCRSLCQALLYSGSVRAVVMAEPAEPRSKRPTPKLWTIEQSDRPCPIPRSADEWLNGWKGPAEMFRFIDARAVAGECLVDRPTALPVVGLTLEYQRVGTWPGDEKSSLTLFTPLSGDRTIMTRRTPGELRVEARLSTIAPRKLQIPLHFSIAGSPNSGAYWEWSREIRKVDGNLDKWLTTKIADVTGPTPTALRTAVDRWLSQPEVGIQQTDRDLQDHYFRMVDKVGDIREDLPRVEAILRDPRTERISFLWMVLRKFPQSAKSLLDIVLDRMAALPADDKRNSGFAGSFDSFPASLFNDLNPKLVDLLQQPARRKHMEQGILRLGDAGPEAAPILIKILDQSLAEHPGDITRESIAAISAICKIAPSIAPAYEPIERLVSRDRGAQERLIRGFGSWLWGVTRVRLGRSPANIGNPVAAGTIRPQSERNLREDAAEGQCDMR